MILRHDKIQSFITWLRNHRAELILFSVAFGIRFLYALVVRFSYGQEGFIAYSDASYFYVGAARNLLNYQVFSLDFPPTLVSDPYRTPLYTGLIAALLWVKSSFFIIAVIQNILAGIMSVLVYRIGRKLFEAPGIAWFAALVSSLEPLSIYWNNLLMSDYFFAFLFVLAVYYFVNQRFYRFAFVLGLATLTRPVSLYFLPLFLLTFIVWSRSDAVIRTVQTAKIGLSMIIIFLVVLLPWSVRNQLTFGTWQLSSASWYNLYHVVTNEFTKQNNLVLPTRTVTFAYTNPAVGPYAFENIPFYKENFLRIVKEHPQAYLVFYGKRVLASLFVNPYNYLVNFVLKVKLSWLFNAVPGVVISIFLGLGGLFWKLTYLGLVLSVFDKRHALALTLFLGILGINFLTLGALVPPEPNGAGADSSRYLLPLAPFCFLFAAAGFAHLAQLARKWIIKFF